MENFDEEWMSEFRRQVEQHLLYRHFDREMDQVRPQYRLLRETLPPDQRAILDRYFYLSQQLEIAMTYSAYLQGMRYGQQHPKA